MKKQKTQSEKLFTHDELRKVVRKIDSLQLMEKIDNSYGLSKIFNNTNYSKTKSVIMKLIKR